VAKPSYRLISIGENVIDAKLDECLNEFINKEQLPLTFKAHALKWFKPIFTDVLMHQINAKRPLFIGVNGSQGSGKSTLSQLLTEFINQATDYNAVTLSLDDFYLNKDARNELAKKQHQMFATRGVPGTHDTQLMYEVLNKLKTGQPCRLPRFNKAIDNPFPIDECPLQETKVDFVILEGWCWGVTAAPDEELIQPVNEMESSKDAFMLWRQYSNQVLSTEYQPLYELFDYWIMLKAPSFDCVYKWRCEQEDKLRAKNADAPGIMNEAQIYAFIQHYQRLTERCLGTLPKTFDLVFELNHDREIIQAIYK
jgi:D-glycerate 3-kinase